MKLPGMISDTEADIKWRDRLFYGVLKTLRDSIRYLYWSTIYCAAGPSKNNQVPHQCYHCWGWDHMAKECTMSLNYSKGGSFNEPSPKVQETQMSRELNRCIPSKPHHAQSIKRMLSQSRSSGLPHWKGK